MENMFESNRRLVKANLEQEQEFKSALFAIQEADMRTEGEAPHPENFQEVFEFFQQNLPIFLERYGLKGNSIISPEILIFSPNHVYKEHYDAHGRWLSDVQKIEIYRSFIGPHKLRMMATLAHEMIHAQAFQSWQEVQEVDRDDTTIIDRSEDGSLSYYKNRRQGLRINDGTLDDYFSDLDEAVTEELTIRFMEEFREGIPTLEDDVYIRDYVLDDMGESLAVDKREVHSVDEEEQGEEKQLTLKCASYREERKEMWDLIDSLRDYDDEFSSREEIFGILARGAMTGNILPFARLVQKVFGKDAFRTLGQRTLEGEPRPPSLR